MSGQDRQRPSELLKRFRDPQWQPLREDYAALLAALARAERERDEALARVRDLEAALERIGWHELTWLEARDAARAALAAPDPEDAAE